jgi:branched-chain amino acid transport system ATP-binding protein
MTAALRTQGLTKRFGGLTVNSGIDFLLPVGGRHALIGPNGAGKTTFINLLAGSLVPSSGEVFLGEECVTSWPQHRRVRQGIARTFQITTLFPGLTVLESVILAMEQRKGMIGVWRTTVSRQGKAIEEARDLLDRLLLAGDADTVTRQLPYGKQRLVEIALALATRPRILLLDEPAAGIPTGASAEIFGVLGRLPADVSILLIEHDMDLVFRFAQRITVLAGGCVLAEGSPAEVAANPRVREVYLGEADHG